MDSRLTQVLNTLNLIEVQGKDNLNRLLGCILVLEDIIGTGNVDAPAKEVLPEPLPEGGEVEPIE